ncbi:RhuM family protein [Paracoccus luteus]|uniref:RhuM family protein n=1 Tax=Paracoccus luteus TaxID=2508543 RepID=UPI00106FDD44|nr:RhuM family protein [Paracoccus luteus]
MAPKKDNDDVIHQVELVEYKQPGHADPIALRLDPGTETIWATQAQIAELFGTSQQNISYHLKGIFNDGELDQASNTKIICIDSSKKPVRLYSLDAIISAGYRVNSKAATRFRQWATGTLKAFIEQGFVINERALRASPEKLDALAAQIRALRSEEKHVFAKVRECFKMGSSDYDPSSKEVRTFYALLQDKFHYAVTTMTSAKLVMDRADHTLENMGVISFSGKRPTKAEAMVGKNFLTKEELYRLHILSEQFLLYAEATALAGKKMTMASLHAQLDRLLTLNDYKVFGGWEDYLGAEMKRHIDREYEYYLARIKVEDAGLDYDPISRDIGLYDHILSA